MSRKAISIAFLVVLSALVLVVAGCGSSKKSEDTTTTAAAVDTTTAAETTTEDTDTESTDTDATTTDSGGGGASKQECEDFAKAASSVGTQFSQALSGAGGADIEKASQAFDDLTAKAPADVRDDFQTIDDAFKKMAVALKGVDLSSGKTPDAATLAKLSKLGTEIDQAKLSQASQNISAWAASNCSS